MIISNVRHRSLIIQCESKKTTRHQTLVKQHNLRSSGSFSSRRSWFEVSKETPAEELTEAICHARLTSSKQLLNDVIVICRRGSSPQILEGALPRQPLHDRVHFLRSLQNRKNTNIGLRLKSIVIRVANSVICNPRPVETRPEGPRAGVGFLTGAASPSHQLGAGERCKLGG